MEKVFFSTRLLFCFLFALSQIQAQDKQPLDHSVYDNWKNLNGASISNNGEYVSFEINPQDGDGWLYIKNLSTQSSDSIRRGYNAAFSPQSNFIVCNIKAPKDSTRNAKLAKKKDDQLPKDSLGIWLLEKDSLIKAANLKSYKLSKDTSPWFAYHLEKQAEKKDTAEVKEEEKIKSEKKRTGKKKDDEIKTGDLFICNPVASKKYIFNDVSDYAVSENGDLISFITAKSDSVDSAAVYVFKPSIEQADKIFEMQGRAKNISVDKLGQQVAFISTTDTSKAKVYNLLCWMTKLNQAEMIIDTLTQGMPGKWSVSEHAGITFSDDCSKLYFRTAPKPKPVPKDTLTDDDKVKVDIWNWKDTRLQSQQLVECENDMKRSYQAIYHIREKRMAQLGDNVVHDVTILKDNPRIALGIDTRSYEKLISWEYPEYRDAYVIDCNSGANKIILKKKQFGVSISPFGKYVLWFENADSLWYAYSVKNNQYIPLTKNIPVQFYNEQHDEPCPPTPYGIGGWAKNDECVMIYDRFDIWKIDPEGRKAPVNLTRAYGRNHKIRLRVVDLDKEQEYFELKESLLLSGFNETSKQDGFYSTRLSSKNDPAILIVKDNRFEHVVKAKQANRLIWTKSSFIEYPDLWESNLTFENPIRLSDANPQQQHYLWGSVELIKWKDYNGNELEGLVYKPENFNPNKKYPMLVYFYERSSFIKYWHFVPKPSPSTINFSYYVSNGYVVFVPDIVYGTGHPGNDAYNAVVSGTMNLLKSGYIDEKKIGIQGQSWGGYQVAYLVTRTNLYAAAMAGAPVSNMTSAYGGIRWKSGLSRMFQYEQDQSRIGANLWERPELYIENSPVFHAPEVQTPLLIMHNDNDGAVPWYQGIELFVALRRLNKPVWMLTYNGDEHNLKRRANQKDLSIRMQQFFDHYLKYAPAPEWMENGIPAVDKGEKMGYDLIEDTGLGRK
ncbi:S9 family peptidase [candidate division KSB1 bacterium]|nr:S9 family peptidase [candidate division KSB1 bacterium]